VAGHHIPLATGTSSSVHVVSDAAHASSRPAPWIVEMPLRRRPPAPRRGAPCPAPRAPTRGELGFASGAATVKRRLEALRVRSGFRTQMGSAWSRSTSRRGSRAVPTTRYTSRDRRRRPSRLVATSRPTCSSRDRSTAAGRSKSRCVSTRTAQSLIPSGGSRWPGTARFCCPGSTTARGRTLRAPGSPASSTEASASSE